MRDARIAASTPHDCMKLMDPPYLGSNSLRFQNPDDGQIQVQVPLHNYIHCPPYQILMR